MENFKIIDMNTYKRKTHFEYFKSLAYPYVGVTVNVDITKIVFLIKEKKLPFFLTICYAIANSANIIKEFKQRIVDDKIIEYDTCKTSHTVSLNDGTYGYCTLKSDMPFEEYLPYAVKMQENAISHPSKEDGTDANELFFISTLPWISYTNMINPVPIPADSNPRITWGKYFHREGNIYLPVSVLCNHALVDGIHISEFYKNLDNQLGKLCSLLEKEF